MKPRVGIAIVFALASAMTAEAAIVCQHPKRAKQIRLEPGPECAKKGWVRVADLSKLVSANEFTPLSDLVVAELGATCAGDGALALASPLTTEPYDGCRRYDGNPTQCAASFQTTVYGAASCTYYRGRCYPCAGAFEGYSICTNACRPPSCPAAPSRTFAGSNCYGLSQLACNTSYVQSQSGGLKMATLATPAVAEETVYEAPRSCYWNGNYCTSCDVYQQNMGSCTNACVAVPACGTRTFGTCSSAGTPEACAQRFGISELTGLAVSCEWNGGCALCDEATQFHDKGCTNTCP